MNKLNLPPFYVGQRVVSKHNFRTGDIKIGDEFTVTGVFKSNCPCNLWDITIGVKSNSSHGCCDYCDTRWVSGGERIFSSEKFAPIQQQNFPLIKLSKIMEKEKEEILIEN